MSKRKDHPEKVIPEIAVRAIADTDQRTAIWSHYIMRHYQVTGNLAPGCDARDLYAWLEANMPDELAARTQPVRTETTGGKR
jgi:hypothetical protein